MAEANDLAVVRMISQERRLKKILTRISADFDSF